MINMTSTNAETILAQVVPYREAYVWLTNELDDSPPWLCNHDLQVMHHFGDQGEHYCPTGFVQCVTCGAVGDEPEPYECRRSGV